MPDIHQGYGFPIGGIAATAIDEGGVISPGGIGYDINSGVRLLAVSLSKSEIMPYIEQLADALYDAVPSGVGKGGRLYFNHDELDDILQNGAHAMVQRDYGTKDDATFCENTGCMTEACPEHVSEKAKNRGRDQIGTLGSGNHFLEVQYVDEILDPAAAETFGLKKGMITVMIHCGSRGFGHQVCTDYVKKMTPKLADWGITLPDPQLACAPLTSDEGKQYFGAMASAANFAWANRHTIGHWVRETFQNICGDNVSVQTVYDVSHNIGKKEYHDVNGTQKELLVHRKGATRAFGPDRDDIPSAYKDIGHPVLIPGTMGTSSYILVGTGKDQNTAFESSCHGAGRRMSRNQAKKAIEGKDVQAQLKDQGIIIRAGSYRGLAEEAPIAYKDVDNVVAVIEDANLGRRVARVKPLAVIKG
jgi:tRNA-splicing ligase RtcB